MSWVLGLGVSIRCEVMVVGVADELLEIKGCDATSTRTVKDRFLAMRHRRSLSNYSFDNMAAR